MSITTRIKNGVNHLLRPLNLRLDTLTAERKELRRLAELEERGLFNRSVFPVPSCVDLEASRAILEELPSYRDRFASFQQAERNDVGYTFENNFFYSPDAEVLYTMLRWHRPQTVIEVGSGSSTRIMRQAIIDGSLDTKLISIDPQPRADVDDLADEVHRERVERGWQTDTFRVLEPGDMLFIDSSHEILPGNDVVFLYLNVLPVLRRGVLIHIHDVFLPYEYPKEWIIDKRRTWNEQYLVQRMLMNEGAFEVLWAGHYLQRTDSDFEKSFPHMETDTWASSLWLRTLTEAK